MTMSDNDKQVILAEVQAARAEHRPVNQQAIRALLPHVSISALNSRVARLRRALNNPQPPRRRRTATSATAAPPLVLPTDTVTTAATTATAAPPQVLTTDTVMTASTTPSTGAVLVQAANAWTTAPAGRADEEVQVAMELARFGSSSSAAIHQLEQEQDDQVQQVLSATQEELVDVRSQVQTTHTAHEREETIRMQDEDILSSWAERVQLKSTISAIEREFQAVRSQVQVVEADIASKDETIMKLNQDLQALRSDQEAELRQLKSTLTATEAELSLIRTQVAEADNAKDRTIMQLTGDVQGLRRQIAASDTVLLQRKLDNALKENASKDDAIEKLKHDMKQAKEAFSSRLSSAQFNITNQVTQNYVTQVEDLKNQVQDLKHRYGQDMLTNRTRIATLEQELGHTGWVTDVHKYLVSVEEDLQALADRLSRFLAPQDRSTLYSKRNLSEISPHPTMRWACHVYARYYGMAPQVTVDMETDMTKWWLDRNYFAHHSNTDELARRGKVLANAKDMHRHLLKLIEDLNRDQGADLTQLANDAFSDVFH
jgi:hypothetical protein